MKDEILKKLSYNMGVLPFVSVAPNGAIRHVVLRGDFWGTGHSTDWKVIAAVIKSASAYERLSVRTFKENRASGNPFLYDVSYEEAIEFATDMMKHGYIVMINEATNSLDGFISGIIINDTVVMAPFVTPRFVEYRSMQPAVMPLPIAEHFLSTMAGTRINLQLLTLQDMRVEFSVLLGKQRNHQGGRVVIWERTPCVDVIDTVMSNHEFPNDFSRSMGDKAYGLLMANSLDFKVPYTQVISRYEGLPDFRMGVSVNPGKDVFLRPAPSVPVPGKYDTVKSDMDPFKFMENMDDCVVSVLAQEDLCAEYSGVALYDAAGNLKVEGVKDFGGGFMLGKEHAVELPEEVVSEVTRTMVSLKSHFESPHIEWGYRGGEVWLFQLHNKSSGSAAGIVDGDAEYWHFIDPEAMDLEDFRSVVKFCSRNGVGLVIPDGTSQVNHAADIIRAEGVPAIFRGTVESLNATEALFAFIGELCSSDERLVLGGTSKPPYTIANLMTEFVNRQNLPDLREDWASLIRKDHKLLKKGFYE